MRYGQNKMRIFGMLSVWIIMAVLGSVPMAQGFDMNDNPCVDDAKKLCSNVVPGNGRTVKCLLEQENVSIFCKDWITSAFKKAEGINSVCARERAQMCPYGNDNMAALIYCLNSNYYALSQDCRDKVKEIIDRF
jgi:hypothetical protein